MLGPSLHKSYMRLIIPAKVADVWTAGLVCGVFEHIFDIIYDVDAFPLLLARRKRGSRRVCFGLEVILIDNLRSMAFSACLTFCLTIIFLKSSKTLQVLQNVILCQ